MLRTLSSMNTDSETYPGKWVGVQFRSYLFLTTLSKNRLRGLFKNSRYTHIHDYMSGGFDAHLSSKVRFFFLNFIQVRLAF